MRQPKHPHCRSRNDEGVGSRSVDVVRFVATTALRFLAGLEVNLLYSRARPWALDASLGATWAVGDGCGKSVILFALSDGRCTAHWSLHSLDPPSVDYSDLSIDSSSSFRTKRPGSRVALKSAITITGKMALYERMMPSSVNCSLSFTLRAAPAM